MRVAAPPPLPARHCLLVPTLELPAAQPPKAVARRCPSDLQKPAQLGRGMVKRASCRKRSLSLPPHIIISHTMAAPTTPFAFKLATMLALLALLIIATAQPALGAEIDTVCSDRKDAHCAC